MNGYGLRVVMKGKSYGGSPMRHYFVSAGGAGQKEDIKKPLLEVQQAIICYLLSNV